MGVLDLPHTLATKDGDVIRVPVPSTRLTAPCRGASSCMCALAPRWGVRAVRAHLDQPSVEGVEMT